MTSAPTAVTPELRERVERHSWYHTIEIAPGLVTDGWFDYGGHARFLADSAVSIEAFRERQARAFGAEKDRWRAAGERAGRGGL